MKRNQLLRHLKEYGCLLLREGRRHSVFYNLKTEKTSTIPRHREIDDMLANKIYRDLGVPPMR